ncbi:plasmid stabilization system [Rhodovulum sp. PH10]|uniref:type II toxin-antitoxin system RelE family toxin n=1 Tax=Rhodovulum sp. PH10 TaxID=1187851 RepID=UPI00027C2935|nr:type II toxin-antitoxin system RelE/ParE family toxin [Rhodovulum sp. PH10]EJW11265.1 plasmid stabilization system [Rhodovulum sp. PH10]
MKTVVHAASAARQRRRLEGETRQRIDAKLVRYAETGEGDVKRLTGRPGIRLRVGDWRVIFVENDTTITVLAVGHRREIYD